MNAILAITALLTANPDAAALAKMRLEVEELAEQVSAERAQLRRDRQIWSQEAQALELSVIRTKARVTALNRAMEALKRAAAERSAAQHTDRPPLLAALERISTIVEQGLPFRTEQRLRDLAEIRRGLHSRALPPDRAANRMWRFVREELRLAETSGLGRSVVSINQERIMAETARLGMVAMLFRLPDGRTGYTRPHHGGHRFVLAKTEEERTAILATFDTLKRGHVSLLRVPARCFSEAKEP